MNNYLTYFNKIKLTDDSTQYILRIFGVTCWVSLHSDKINWFRIFGCGLIWKHESNNLRFSERYGYKKYLKIGKWVIEWLPCR